MQQYVICYAVQVRPQSKVTVVTESKPNAHKEGGNEKAIPQSSGTTVKSGRITATSSATPVPINPAEETKGQQRRWALADFDIGKPLGRG